MQDSEVESIMRTVVDTVQTYDHVVEVRHFITSSLGIRDACNKHFYRDAEICM
jgi:hypothetical protein